MSQENQTPDYMRVLGPIHYITWKLIKVRLAEEILLFEEGDYCFAFMQDAFVVNKVLNVPLRPNDWVFWACALSKERVEWACTELKKANFRTSKVNQIIIPLMG